MNRSARVFVTGVGIISPAGAGAAPFWGDLCAAHHRFTELTPLYPGMKTGTLGGRVPREAREIALARVGAQTRARPRTASLFSEYAALEALRDAGLESGDDTLRDALVCIGSSDGQADVLEDIVANRGGAAEFGRFSSFSISEGVAAAVGSRGPAFTTHSTCASSNVAVSCAVEMLRSGVAGAAVVGGCDPYSEKNIIGFNSLQSIGSARCRPFSRDRRYVTPSEGAGVLVLQTEDALRPSQQPYAEILATAITNDAGHPTAPDRDGVEACHRRALGEAGITAADVEVIFAHGTGSRANDAVEGGIFTDSYPGSVVTAIKGTVGHLMGAAGAAGAVASCLTLRHGLVPPTAVQSDEVDLDLNLVTGAPLAMPRLRYVQNNSFGFGGNNAISIFRNVA